MQINLAAFYFDGKRSRTALIRRDRPAILQLYIPAVQRAGHLAAEDDPLGERAALVRTAIAKGEYVVFRSAKNGDITLLALHHPGAQRRDIGEGADAPPR